MMIIMTTMILFICLNYALFLWDDECSAFYKFHALVMLCKLEFLFFFFFSRREFVFHKRGEAKEKDPRHTHTQEHLSAQQSKAKLKYVFELIRFSFSVCFSFLSEIIARTCKIVNWVLVLNYELSTNYTWCLFFSDFFFALWVQK